MPVRSIRPEQVFLAIGHLVFLGLFALAAIHYQERTIHVDSAFQIYKWIQFDQVQVEAHRYTAIVPQLLVKVGKASGLDLRALLALASAAHVAVAYVIFLLAAYVTRTTWVAIASALAAVLCTRLTFYGIVLEANYLLSYPFLIAALLEGPLQRSVDIRSMGLACVALALVLVVHPVGALIALFVLALAFVRWPSRRRPLLVLIAITVLWGCIGRLVFPPSGYESALYTSAGEGLSSLNALGRNASLDFLVRHTWQDSMLYLPLWLLFFALLADQLRQRAWSSAALCCTAVIGYMLINFLTYRTGESAMILEKNFVPLATLVALPLMGQVERRSLTVRWWLVVPFLFVVFTQFRGISFASRPVHERLVRIEHITDRLHEQGVRKAMIPDAELDAYGLHVHWALPFETLLLSGLEGPGKCVTAVACLPTGTGFPTASCIPSSLVPAGPTEQLQGRFFHLPKEPFTVTSSPVGKVEL